MVNLLIIWSIFLSKLTKHQQSLAWRDLAYDTTSMYIGWGSNPRPPDRETSKTTFHSMSSSVPGLKNYRRLMDWGIFLNTHEKKYAPTFCQGVSVTTVTSFMFSNIRLGYFYLNLDSLN